MQLKLHLIFLTCYVLSACLFVLFFVTTSRGIFETFLSNFAALPRPSNVTAARPIKNNATPLFAKLHSLNGARDNGSNPVKKILLWSPLYHGWEFMPSGSHVFAQSECPEVRCTITTERSLLRECHAVVFHIRTFAVYDTPTYRRPQQKWIFFSLEAPPYSYFPGFSFMSGMFNWTMTYREDSDVVIRYGDLKPGKRKKAVSQPDLDKLWRSKSKTVVWMVSHCSTAGRREAYVEEFQKYMDVDVMGSCGVAVCPREKTDLCLEAFAKQYKFFFAFENAICKDYVTEKFFRVLKYDIVPVVFGGGDYRTFAPPKSYINAMDYTPKNLARYLKRLASNSSLYFEYFKWKEKGYDIRDYPDLCQLCTKLHSSSFSESSVYRDIEDWWSSKSRCRTWKNPVR